MININRLGYKIDYQGLGILYRHFQTFFYHIHT